MKKIFVFMAIILFTTFVYAGELVKVSGWHHSVTENGNIQVRIVTEYIKDGKIIDKQYSEPMTPPNPKDMTGWDDRSKDIVAAISAPEAKAELVAEKQKPTGIGIEEIVTYDRVIDEDGKIAVRRIIRIYDNGVEVSKKFHRSWIMPGDDPTGNDVISKAVAKKVHTPKVIAEYKAKMEKLKR